MGLVSARASLVLRICGWFTVFDPQSNFFAAPAWICFNHSSLELCKQIATPELFLQCVLESNSRQGEKEGF